MSEDRPNKLILKKNNIKNFILRIDLIINDKLIIAKMAEEMSKYFETTEKREVANFAINFTKETSEIKNQFTTDYVLKAKDSQYSLTFSENANCFYIESTQYENNLLYKDVIKKAIEVIEKIIPGVKSKRIGLRYINVFDCSTKKEISKIFSKRLSSTLNNMLGEENQSRLIAVEHYNFGDGFKFRLQYGINNDFFPSVIKKYDLVMDLDSYLDDTCNTKEWEEKIKKLNHDAAVIFEKGITQKYLEALKNDK